MFIQFHQIPLLNRLPLFHHMCLTSCHKLGGRSSVSYSGVLFCATLIYVPFFMSIQGCLCHYSITVESEVRYCCICSSNLSPWGDSGYLWSLCFQMNSSFGFSRSVKNYIILVGDCFESPYCFSENIYLYNINSASTGACNFFLLPNIFFDFPFQYL